MCFYIAKMLWGLLPHRCLYRLRGLYVPDTFPDPAMLTLWLLLSTWFLESHTGFDPVWSPWKGDDLTRSLMRHNSPYRNTLYQPTSSWYKALEATPVLLMCFYIANSLRAGLEPACRTLSLPAHLGPMSTIPSPRVHRVMTPDSGAG